MRPAVEPEDRAHLMGLALVERHRQPGREIGRDVEAGLGAR